MSALQQEQNKALSDDDRDSYGDSAHLPSGLSVHFQIPESTVALQSSKKLQLLLDTA